MIRRWPLLLALAALAFTLLLAYQSAVFTSRSGDAAPLYSTRRHDPYGTAALYALLAESGVPTRTLERATLRPDDRGTLIQVLDSKTSTSGTPERQPQTQQLADWIQQGNTVIQFTRRATDLMRFFHIDAAAEVAKRELEDIQTAETSGQAPSEVPGVSQVATLTDSRNGLVLRSPMTLADRPENTSWRVLARSALEKHKVVAGEYRVGRGRLVIVGASTPALNYALEERGNLDFILAVVGHGPVLFDEWSHYIGHSATVVGFLKDAGLVPLMLQIVFIVSLFVWSTMGRPISDENASPGRGRSAAEQISTLGFLYARSLGFEATFDRVQAELHRRLADALRCRPADVRTRIAMLSPELRDRCERLFSRLSQVRPERDVRCTNCGYDLRGNSSGRCPECGASPSLEVRRRVAAVDASETAPPARQASHPEAVFVDVLNQSHSLSEEIRSVRRVLP